MNPKKDGFVILSVATHRVTTDKWQKLDFSEAPQESESN